MQDLLPRTFTVQRLIGEGQSRRGDFFVEAATTFGVIAFWGSKANRANLALIQSANIPFTITCGCILPSGAYANRHSYWVPETPLLAPPKPSGRPTARVLPSTMRSSLSANMTQLIAEFAALLDLYDCAGPFRRPGQLEWHRKTIDRRLALSCGAAAVQDEKFLRCLYETLQAWGIGYRESRLRSYRDFVAELARHESAIADLDSFAIDDSSDRLQTARQRLWELLDDLTIVDNKARVVSGTKALHHVLPHLVVPMDRAYTQVFFGWQNPRFQYSQRECFSEAFEAFGTIARAVKPARFVGDAWRSSRTKVIDNAVVAFVQTTRQHLKSKAPGNERS